MVRTFVYRPVRLKWQLLNGSSQPQGAIIPLGCQGGLEPTISRFTVENLETNSDTDTMSILTYLVVVVKTYTIPFSTSAFHG